jgi:hypothetical protein
VLAPAFKDPQFIEVRALLQALSEYTPKFAETFTAPLDGTFWVELMAAKVVSVNAIATVTKAITAAVTEIFIFGVVFPS